MSREELDFVVSAFIDSERCRQQNEISLIASENYVSSQILQATGSVLTNKYAEGYPGKRYYAGCGWVDKIEQLAIDRCKQLFKVQHANVQPHAGSQANMAAYLSVLNQGDTILGMSLAAGGHLTHGHSVNFSGKIFKVVQYTVDPHTELIDFSLIANLVDRYRPKMIIAGASAYSRVIDFELFKDIARSVDAYLLADIAHIAGLVAAGIHPSPVGHADIITSTTHKTLRGPRGGLIMCNDSTIADLIDRAVLPGTQGGPLMHVIAAKAMAFFEALQPEFVEYQKQIVRNAQKMAAIFIEHGYRVITGGTDNHLFVIDLTAKNINGYQAEVALEKSGIAVSRSCIPFDPKKPGITSGIRIGTAAMTTRGMQENEAVELVELIDYVVTHHDDIAVHAKIRERVKQLCYLFPINSLQQRGNNPMTFSQAAQ